MKRITNSLEEFKNTARDFARGLSPRIDRATVVGLYGDLGAGKTTFTQAVGEELGVGEKMTSPTFVIMKRFKIKDLGFKFENLIHIDSYRLKSGEDLIRLGWNEIVTNPGNLILVEWADRITDILPEDRLEVRLTFIDEHTRCITTER